MKLCGNPHKSLKCLQIAGTNGKGSVAAMIAKILSGLNFSIGLYTSPHLINVNERIRINNEPIKDDEIEGFINKYKNVIEKTQASFFETITTLAFNYFCNKNVDYAILETGLGGRYDSVTVCNPELTIMTPIALDHVEILGNTLEKITMEKTGILKNNIPLISAYQNPIVKRIIKKEARKKNCPVNFCKKDEKIILNNLKGEHQEKNAALATNAVLALNIKNTSKEMIRSSVLNTRWYGRYQIIKNKPLVIFDVGHNEHGIKSFLKEYSKEIISGKKYLIIALQRRKKIDNIIEILKFEFDKIIFTQTSTGNSMNVKILKNCFGKSNGLIIENSKNALFYCKNKLQKKDSLVILGTHHLAESIQRVYKNSFDIL